MSLLGRVLLVWLLCTGLGCLWFAQSARITPGPPPSSVLGKWAMETLDRVVPGGEAAKPPSDHLAPEPVIVSAWWGGKLRVQHRGSDDVARHQVRCELNSAKTHVDGSWVAGAPGEVKESLT